MSKALPPFPMTRLLQWRFNVPGMSLSEGDRFLVAFPVEHLRDEPKMEYAVLEVDYNEENLLTEGGSPWPKQWEDVVWFCPVEELSPT